MPRTVFTNEWLSEKKMIEFMLIIETTKSNATNNHYIRLETKSCRILPLTYGTKYDMT